MKLFTLSLLSLAGAVSAQSGEWQQCGGANWSGDSTCISGWTCIYENEWYSQCQPVSTTSISSMTTTSSSVSTSTTATTLVTATSSTSTTSSASTATNSVFPGRSGLNFTINGEVGYFAGTNAYWIGFLTDNSDVDTVLDDIAAAGIKILRIWGFNDVNTVPSSGTVYFQLLSNGVATINTGSDGLQRLDYVVAAAEARGISLIINFVNNWTDYGGMAAYINAFDSGASQTSWYTNSECQSAYQAYIKAVVSRYIDSPAIFAWELANEPRCDACGETTTLYNWIQTTSAYIKSLDPNHMVGIGDEGMGLSINSDGSYPYTTYEGSDFTENLSISTIDFGTLHLYPSSWGTSNTWGNAWITNHGIACAAAGKPCLLEEYGVTSNKCSVEGSWQTTALESDGIAADSFWQWGDTISTGETPNDEYTIYDPSSDFTCLVTDHITAIASAR